jgi:radical SAM protein with 4Fe4S-binding SPASM domain
VEFSIDFPTEQEQDEWRSPGNWRKCWEGVARCKRLGVQTAIIAVMLNTNYAKLADLAEVAGEHGVDFRFNVYQPVKGDIFSLTYAQFWEGILGILERTEIITISEPLVNALIGFSRPTNGSPCGKTSLRVLPNQLVSPCTYWSAPDRKLPDLYNQKQMIFSAPSFQNTRQIPPACKSCHLVEICGGGCASRRLLLEELAQPDEFCPIIRNDSVLLERLAKLGWRSAEFKELPKAGNACTFVVRSKTREEK